MTISTDTDHGRLGQLCNNFQNNLTLSLKSMQAKQKSLLERVDAFDEECEELQRQLGESEERQIKLHNQIQQMSEEKDQLHAKLNQQQVYFLKTCNYVRLCQHYVRKW